MKTIDIISNQNTIVIVSDRNGKILNVVGPLPEGAAARWVRIQELGVGKQFGASYQIRKLCPVPERFLKEFVVTACGPFQMGCTSKDVTVATL